MVFKWIAEPPLVTAQMASDSETTQHFGPILLYKMTYLNDSLTLDTVV